MNYLTTHQLPNLLPASANRVSRIQHPESPIYLNAERYTLSAILIFLVIALYNHKIVPLLNAVRYTLNAAYCGCLRRER